MVAVDSERRPFEEVGINADKQLALFRFGRHFVSPILGWGVVGSDEEVRQCWDTGREGGSQGGYNSHSSVKVTTAASWRITTMNSITLMCSFLDLREALVSADR